MRSREWPLIIFTILIQLAVGSWLVLFAIRLLASRQLAPELIDSLTRPAMIGIVLVLVIGVFAAVLHLSHPFRTFRAIANLGSSGLSREMLLGVLFGLTVCLYAVMEWVQLGLSAAQAIIAVFAVLNGVALVYTVSRSYMLRTVPAWNTPATPISFFTTAVLLGILAVALELVITFPVIEAGGAHHAFLVNALRWGGSASAVLVVVQLVVVSLNSTYLSTQGGAAAESVRTVFTNYRGLLVLRLILALLGVGLFVTLVYQNTLHPSQTVTAVILTLAFALVFASELMGRFLFYVSHKRVGL
jgi:anaerobic dimethyl sulfoxide reductase subunit C (anchor subunit)